MKLIPRNYDLFADVFDDMFNSSLTRGVSSIMKTDIHEKDGNYVVDVELPGYKKEDIGKTMTSNHMEKLCLIMSIKIQQQVNFWLICSINEVENDDSEDNGANDQPRFI